MSKSPLFEIGRQRLLDLQSELETIRSSIATLKDEGGIAAKGTAIASYRARGASGIYYDYYKFIKRENETLIHLGREDSQWLKDFRSAVKRRSELDCLEKQRGELKKEIDTLKTEIASLNPD